VKDCVSPIKVDEGSASYRKQKEYQKMKVAGMEPSEESSSPDSVESSEESSEESSQESSREDCEEQESEGEYLEDDEEKAQLKEEDRNWWASPPCSESDQQATLSLKGEN